MPELSTVYINSQSSKYMSYAVTYMCAVIRSSYKIHYSNMCSVIVHRETWVYLETLWRPCRCMCSGCCYSRTSAKTCTTKASLRRYGAQVKGIMQLAREEWLPISCRRASSSWRLDPRSNWSGLLWLCCIQLTSSSECTASCSPPSIWYTVLINPRTWASRYLLVRN